MFITMKPILNLIALPHTQVSKSFYHCAYTCGKILNFCKMMQDFYTIRLYAPEGPPVEGATLIPCLSDKRRQEIFGEDDMARLFSWPNDSQSAEFNLNVIAELKKNIQPGEMILLSGGYTHHPISAAFPQYQRVEPFCGYLGILPDTFVAFESFAHMHTVYAKKGIEDIRYFDAVIPPFIDEDDFPLLNKRDGKYLLFIGRLIFRKGIQTAAEIAKATGLPLYVAGGGAKHLYPGFIIAGDGTRIECPGLKYCGAVAQHKRNELMAGATAVLVPTTYCGPGENVSLEANFSGTPVITTDFGCFSETVQNGVNGFRFRTLQEAVDAVKACPILRPTAIRNYVSSKYSLPATALKFDNWFRKIYTVKEKGWYTLTS
jgi:glycosyltransferase involved in cell wall biosynthesis